MVDPGFFNSLIKIQRRFLSYTENQRCLLKSVSGCLSDYGESFGRKNFPSVDYPSFLFKSTIVFTLRQFIYSHEAWEQFIDNLILQHNMCIWRTQATHTQYEDNQECLWYNVLEDSKKLGSSVAIITQPMVILKLELVHKIRHVFMKTLLFFRYT